MYQGTVKWFNNQKGYGFICGADGKDIFIHYSGIEQEGYKTLEEGIAVEYEIDNSGKGPQAVKVKRI